MRDGLATAILWAAYLGLARAAIDGVFDLLRGRITSLEGKRVLAVMPTLAEYGIFIAINAAILIGWALYNYVRFHGPDRRRTINPVTRDEVARFFAADAATAAAMASARIGVLHHDSEGRILRFEPVAVPTTAAAAGPAAGTPPAS